MNDIIGNVAQELADHLDDLRADEGVVPNFGDGDDFPITDVTDADLKPVFGEVGFFATVGGKRVKVSVSEA